MTGRATGRGGGSKDGGEMKRRKKGGRERLLLQLIAKIAWVINGHFEAWKFYASRKRLIFNKLIARWLKLSFCATV